MQSSLIFIFIASWCFNANAWDAHSTVTKVKYIYAPVGSGSSPFISFEENTLPGCYGNKGAYLIFSENNERNADTVYSTLLAAYMAQKPVSVYYDYANTDPEYNGWGKCHISGVDIR